MAGGADQAVRAFAFAEPKGQTWGVGWIAPGAPATAVIGRGESASAVPLELAGHGAEDPWSLRGGGLELELGADSPPVAGQGGFDQLCRARGTVTVTGQTRELDCLGWRGTRPARFSSKAGSFRLLVGWLDHEEGFVLVAVRPRKAKGQDEDAIEAVLFGPAAGESVVEPRLSTTYGDSGWPTRAGVELWMETEEGSDRLYPRRALGQALAEPVSWSASEIALEAQPFHWFSGDHQGPGVYLLGQW